jgi:hypothetical protein
LQVFLNKQTGRLTLDGLKWTFRERTENSLWAGFEPATSRYFGSHAKRAFVPLNYRPKITSMYGLKSTPINHSDYRDPSDPYCIYLNRTVHFKEDALALEAARGNRTKLFFGFVSRKMEAK